MNETSMGVFTVLLPPDTHMPEATDGLGGARPLGFDSENRLTAMARLIPYDLKELETNVSEPAVTMVELSDAVEIAGICLIAGAFIGGIVHKFAWPHIKTGFEKIKSHFDKKKTDENVIYVSGWTEELLEFKRQLDAVKNQKEVL